jgi:hypothetical protein
MSLIKSNKVILIAVCQDTFPYGQYSSVIKIHDKAGPFRAQLSLTLVIFFAFDVFVNVFFVLI